ncbi:MAG: DUF1778 domain-containing protein [Myxococcota bacterium]
MSTRATASARLELRISSASKELIERAADLSDRSVTAFATDVLVTRAREIVEGVRPEADALEPRPIGGWSFSLPDGWDDPLDALEDYR